MRLCCTHFQKKMKQWHHQQKHGSKICVWWRQQLQFSASSCHQRKWHWFDMWPKYEKANTAAWCYWLRASTVVLAPAITGPSKGDTCVIFMILFAYRKSYTFLAKAVEGSQHPRKDSTLPRITTKGEETEDNQIILPM